MKKRGQVVIFVILGIVIVAIITLLVFLASTRNNTAKTEVTASQVDLDSAIKEVNTLVESCLEKISKQAILSAGRFGGYASCSTCDQNEQVYNGRPNNAQVIPGVGPGSCGITALFNPKLEPAGCDLSILGCNLGWTWETLPDPPQNRITEPMEVYINFFFNSCIRNNFEDIEEEGWTVNDAEITLKSDGTPDSDKNYRTKITMDPNSGTLFTFQIPRTFSKGGKSFTIDEYTYQSEINLIEVVEIVKKLRDKLFSGGVLESDPNKRETIYGSIKADIQNKYYFIWGTDPNFQAQLFLLKEKDLTKKNEELFRFLFALYINIQDANEMNAFLQDFFTRYSLEEAESLACGTLSF